MAKLTLTMSPTFAGTVRIPVPGKKAVPVDFTFRARTRDQFQEWLDALSGKDDVDALLDILTGWELEDEFGRESVEKLVQAYPGAARAITEHYIREQVGARSGN